LADYRFLTTWVLETPRERAWDAIEDVVSWPQWWRGVVSARQLEPGDANKVGSRYDIEWRSRLPYPVKFEFRVDRVERPGLMEGRADGELTGTGRWRLFEHDGVTAVLYEWNVRTTRAWMNRLAPVARPVFEYNHNVVMRWGGEGLARRLGVELLAAG
jgi:polyketide cyclase/dehydrase/lipid transport protein